MDRVKNANYILFKIATYYFHRSPRFQANYLLFRYCPVILFFIFSLTVGYVIAKYTFILLDLTIAKSRVIGANKSLILIF